MSVVYTNPENYSNIADAIREKNGSDTEYTPAQMPAAIRAIETDPVIMPLVISENGTYSAPEGVDGYSPVSVNVRGGGGEVSVVGSVYKQNTMTFTYTGVSGNRLLMAVYTRGEMQSGPVGWEPIGTLVESGDRTAGSVTYDQIVYFFTTICTGTMEISYQRDVGENRSECCILELENAGMPALIETTRQENVASSTTALTCRKINTIFTVFVGTAIYWTTEVRWACSNSGIPQIPDDGVTIPRLGVFLDNRTEDLTPFKCGLNMSGRYFSLIGIQVPCKAEPSGANINWYAPKVCVGDKFLPIHTDCELKKPIDLDDYTMSENLSDLTLTDILNLRVSLDNVNMTVGDTVSFESDFNAYRFQNGKAVPLSITVQPLYPQETYEPTTQEEFKRLVLPRMTVVRNNSYADSATDTVSVGFNLRGIGFGAANITSLFLNSDSYITAGNLVININKRDASVYYVWKEEGECDGQHFSKVRWKGASQYNGSIDHEWETVFLENGDVILRLLKQGSYAGTYSFYGISYTPSTGLPMCFYRKNYYGTSWDIREEEYSVDHHYTEADTIFVQTALSDVSSSLTEGYALINGTAYDDNTFSFSLGPDFSWHGVNTLVISGNSWIGIGISSENIRMHRRDAKLWYLYVQYWQLTDLRDLKAVRITWEGASQYNGSTDRRWALWLFENGDAMIYISTRGNNTGTCDFYGQAYTGNDNSYISFYYDPAAGNYSIQYELYTLEHHIQE